MPRNWQFWFQDPATINMEGIIDFHHDLTYIIVILSIFVGYILFVTVYYCRLDKNFYCSNALKHNAFLEIVWTIIPAFILMLIATPSFALLYSIDEVIDPVVTLKAIGHQWYWHYETLGSSFYINFKEPYTNYSILKIENRLRDNEGFGLRLLDVTKENRIVLPYQVSIRLLVTSVDVLHSWAIPSFGIKIDACPGRLNQTSFFLKRVGVFYGQCSEICGTGHAFMPIAVHSVGSHMWIGSEELSSVSIISRVFSFLNFIDTSNFNLKNLILMRAKSQELVKKFTSLPYSNLSFLNSNKYITNYINFYSFFFCKTKSNFIHKMYNLNKKNRVYIIGGGSFSVAYSGFDFDSLFLKEDSFSVENFNVFGVWPSIFFNSIFLENRSVNLPTCNDAFFKINFFLYTKNIVQSFIFLESNPILFKLQSLDSYLRFSLYKEKKNLLYLFKNLNYNYSLYNSIFINHGSNISVGDTKLGFYLKNERLNDVVVPDLENLDEFGEVAEEDLFLFEKSFLHLISLFTEQLAIHRRSITEFLSWNQSFEGSPNFELNSNKNLFFTVWLKEISLFYLMLLNIFNISKVNLNSNFYLSFFEFASFSGLSVDDVICEGLGLGSNFQIKHIFKSQLEILFLNLEKLDSLILKKNYFFASQPNDQDSLENLKILNDNDNFLNSKGIEGTIGLSLNLNERKPAYLTFNGWFRFEKNISELPQFSIYRKHISLILREKYGLLSFWPQEPWFNTSNVWSSELLGTFFDVSRSKLNAHLSNDITSQTFKNYLVTSTRRDIVLMSQINAIIERGLADWLLSLCAAGCVQVEVVWFLLNHAREHNIDPRWIIWVILQGKLYTDNFISDSIKGYDGVVNTLPMGALDDWSSLCEFMVFNISDFNLKKWKQNGLDYYNSNQKFLVDVGDYFLCKESFQNQVSSFFYLAEAYESLKNFFYNVYWCISSFSLWYEEHKELSDHYQRVYRSLAWTQERQEGYIYSFDFTEFEFEDSFNNSSDAELNNFPNLDDSGPASGPGDLKAPSEAFFSSMSNQGEGWGVELNRPVLDTEGNLHEHNRVNITCGYVASGVNRKFVSTLFLPLSYWHAVISRPFRSSEKIDRDIVRKARGAVWNVGVENRDGLPTHQAPVFANHRNTNYKVVSRYPTIFRDYTFNPFNEMYNLEFGVDLEYINVIANLPELGPELGGFFWLPPLRILEPIESVSEEVMVNDVVKVVIKNGNFVGILGDCEYLMALKKDTEISRFDPYDSDLDSPEESIDYIPPSIFYPELGREVEGLRGLRPELFKFEEFDDRRINPEKYKTTLSQFILFFSFFCNKSFAGFFNLLNSFKNFYTTVDLAFVWNIGNQFSDVNFYRDVQSLKFKENDFSVANLLPVGVNTNGIKSIVRRLDDRTVAFIDVSSIYYDNFENDVYLPFHLIFRSYNYAWLFQNFIHDSFSNITELTTFVSCTDCGVSVNNKILTNGFFVSSHFFKDLKKFDAKIYSIHNKFSQQLGDALLEKSIFRRSLKTKGEVFVNENNRLFLKETIALVDFTNIISDFSDADNLVDFFTADMDNLDLPPDYVHMLFGMTKCNALQRPYFFISPFITNSILRKKYYLGTTDRSIFIKLPKECEYWIDACASKDIFFEGSNSVVFEIYRHGKSWLPKYGLRYLEHLSQLENFTLDVEEMPLKYSRLCSALTRSILEKTLERKFGRFLLPFVEYPELRKYFLGYEENCFFLEFPKQVKSWIDAGFHDYIVLEDHMSFVLLIPEWAVEPEFLDEIQSKWGLWDAGEAEEDDLELLLLASVESYNIEERLTDLLLYFYSYPELFPFIVEQDEDYIFIQMPILFVDLFYSSMSDYVFEEDSYAVLLEIPTGQLLPFGESFMTDELENFLYEEVSAVVWDSLKELLDEELFASGAAPLELVNKLRIEKNNFFHSEEKFLKNVLVGVSGVNYNMASEQNEYISQDRLEGLGTLVVIPNLNINEQFSAGLSIDSFAANLARVRDSFLEVDNIRGFDVFLECDFFFFDANSFIDWFFYFFGINLLQNNEILLELALEKKQNFNYYDLFFKYIDFNNWLYFGLDFFLKSSDPIFFSNMVESKKSIQDVDLLSEIHGLIFEDVILEAISHIQMDFFSEYLILSDFLYEESEIVFLEEYDYAYKVSINKAVLKMITKFCMDDFMMDLLWELVYDSFEDMLLYAVLLDLGLVELDDPDFEDVDLIEDDLFNIVNYIGDGSLVNFAGGDQNFQVLPFIDFLGYENQKKPKQVIYKIRKLENFILDFLVDIKKRKGRNVLDFLINMRKNKRKVENKFKEEALQVNDNVGKKSLEKFTKTRFRGFKIKRKSKNFLDFLGKPYREILFLNFWKNKINLDIFRGWYGPAFNLGLSGISESGLSRGEKARLDHELLKLEELSLENRMFLSSDEAFFYEVRDCINGEVITTLVQDFWINYTIKEVDASFVDLFFQLVMCLNMFVEVDSYILESTFFLIKYALMCENMRLGNERLMLDSGILFEDVLVGNSLLTVTNLLIEEVIGEVVDMLVFDSIKENISYTDSYVRMFDSIADNLVNDLMETLAVDLMHSNVCDLFVFDSIMNRVFFKMVHSVIKKSFLNRRQKLENDYALARVNKKEMDKMVRSFIKEKAYIDIKKSQLYKSPTGLLLDRYLKVALTKSKNKAAQRRALKLYLLAADSYAKQLIREDGKRFFKKGQKQLYKSRLKKHLEASNKCLNKIESLKLDAKVALNPEYYKKRHRFRQWIPTIERLHKNLFESVIFYGTTYCVYNSGNMVEMSLNLLDSEHDVLKSFLRFWNETSIKPKPNIKRDITIPGVVINPRSKSTKLEFNYRFKSKSKSKGNKFDFKDFSKKFDNRRLIFIEEETPEELIADEVEGASFARLAASYLGGRVYGGWYGKKLKPIGLNFNFEEESSFLATLNLVTLKPKETILDVEEESEEQSSFLATLNLVTLKPKETILDVDEEGSSFLATLNLVTLKPKETTLSLDVDEERFSPIEIADLNAHGLSLEVADEDLQRLLIEAADLNALGLSLGVVNEDLQRLLIEAADLNALGLSLEVVNEDLQRLLIEAADVNVQGLFFGVAGDDLEKLLIAAMGVDMQSFLLEVVESAAMGVDVDLQSLFLEAEAIGVQNLSLEEVEAQVERLFLGPVSEYESVGLAYAFNMVPVMAEEILLEAMFDYVFFIYADFVNKEEEEEILSAELGLADALLTLVAAEELELMFYGIASYLSYTVTMNGYKYFILFDAIGPIVYSEYVNFHKNKAKSIQYAGGDINEFYHHMQMAQDPRLYAAYSGMLEFEWEKSSGIYRNSFAKYYKLWCFLKYFVDGEIGGEISGETFDEDNYSQNLIYEYTFYNFALFLNLKKRRWMELVYIKEDFLNRMRFFTGEEKMKVSGLSEDLKVRDYIFKLYYILYGRIIKDEFLFEEEDFRNSNFQIDGLWSGSEDSISLNLYQDYDFIKNWDSNFRIFNKIMSLSEYAIFTDNFKFKLNSLGCDIFFVEDNQNFCNLLISPWYSDFFDDSLELDFPLLSGLVQLPEKLSSSRSLIHIVQDSLNNYSLGGYNEFAAFRKIFKFQMNCNDARNYNNNWGAYASQELTAYSEPTSRVFTRPWFFFLDHDLTVFRAFVFFLFSKDSDWVTKWGDYYTEARMIHYRIYKFKLGAFDILEYGRICFGAGRTNILDAPGQFLKGLDKFLAFFNFVSFFLEWSVKSPYGYATPLLTKDPWGFGRAYFGNRSGNFGLNTDINTLVFYYYPHRSSFFMYDWSLNRDLWKFQDSFIGSSGGCYTNIVPGPGDYNHKDLVESFIFCQNNAIWYENIKSKDFYYFFFYNYNKSNFVFQMPFCLVKNENLYYDSTAFLSYEFDYMSNEVGFVSSLDFKKGKNFDMLDILEVSFNTSEFLYLLLYISLDKLNNDLGFDGNNVDIFASEFSGVAINNCFLDDFSLIWAKSDLFHGVSYVRLNTVSDISYEKDINTKLVKSDRGFFDVIFYYINSFVYSITNWEVLGAHETVNNDQDWRAEGHWADLEHSRRDIKRHEKRFFGNNIKKPYSSLLGDGQNSAHYRAVQNLNNRLPSYLEVKTKEEAIHMLYLQEMLERAMFIMFDPDLQREYINAELHRKFAEHIMNLYYSGKHEEIKALARLYQRRRALSYYWFYIKPSLDLNFENIVTSRPHWLVAKYDYSKNFELEYPEDYFTEQVRPVKELNFWSEEYLDSEADGAQGNNKSDPYQKQHGYLLDIQRLSGKTAADYFSRRLDILQRIHPSNFDEKQWRGYESRYLTKRKDKDSLAQNLQVLGRSGETWETERLYDYKNFDKNLADSLEPVYFWWSHDESSYIDFCKQYRVFDYLFLSIITDIAKVNPMVKQCLQDYKSKIQSKKVRVDFNKNVLPYLILFNGDYSKLQWLDFNFEYWREEGLKDLNLKPNIFYRDGMSFYFNYYYRSSDFLYSAESNLVDSSEELPEEDWEMEEERSELLAKHYNKSKIESTILVSPYGQVPYFSSKVAHNYLDYRRVSVKPLFTVYDLLYHSRINDVSFTYNVFAIWQVFNIPWTNLNFLNFFSYLDYKNYTNIIFFNVGNKYVNVNQYKGILEANKKYLSFFLEPLWDESFFYLRDFWFYNKKVFVFSKCLLSNLYYLQQRGIDLHKYLYRLYLYANEDNVSILVSYLYFQRIVAAYRDAFSIREVSFFTINYKSFMYQVLDSIIYDYGNMYITLNEEKEVVDVQNLSGFYLKSKWVRNCLLTHSQNICLLHYKTIMGSLILRKEPEGVLTNFFKNVSFADKAGTSNFFEFGYDDSESSILNQVGFVDPFSIPLKKNLVRITESTASGLERFTNYQKVGNNLEIELASDVSNRHFGYRNNDFFVENFSIAQFFLTDKDILLENEYFFLRNPDGNQDAIEAADILEGYKLFREAASVFFVKRGARHNYNMNSNDYERKILEVSYDLSCLKFGEGLVGIYKNYIFNYNNYVRCYFFFDWNANWESVYSLYFSGNLFLINKKNYNRAKQIVNDYLFFFSKHEANIDFSFVLESADSRRFENLLPALFESWEASLFFDYVEDLGYNFFLFNWKDQRDLNYYLILSTIYKKFFLESLKFFDYKLKDEFSLGWFILPRWSTSGKNKYEFLSLNTVLAITRSLGESYKFKTDFFVFANNILRRGIASLKKYRKTPAVFLYPWVTSLTNGHSINIMDNFITLKLSNYVCFFDKLKGIYAVKYFKLDISKIVEDKAKYFCLFNFEKVKNFEYHSNFIKNIDLPEVSRLCSLLEILAKYDPSYEMLLQQNVNDSLFVRYEAPRERQVVLDLFDRYKSDALFREAIFNNNKLQAGDLDFLLVQYYGESESSGFKYPLNKSFFHFWFVPFKPMHYSVNYEFDPVIDEESSLNFSNCDISTLVGFYFYLRGNKILKSFTKTGDVVKFLSEYEELCRLVIKYAYVFNKDGE